MKQRLYLDTSVFGGYFDIEFAQFTVPLFEKLNQRRFTLLFSTVTESELEHAPESIKKFVLSIKTDQTEFLQLNDEAVNLATEYITEKVVGPTSYADCLHIALATICKADFLVSWNFKHIVNITRIAGYNAINLKNGYKLLDIRSPREFLNYENDN
ncbi:MAG: PIN domain-containing protein [Ginsengibacter sp.]|jgi:predicted nucleic acid-binding protein